MKLFLLTILLVTFSLSAETILEKAEKDEVKSVSKDDPNMLKAYAKARNTLSDFLKRYSAAKTKQDYYLKVAIKDGDDVEYFWIGDFVAKKDNSFEGVINNQPRLVSNVQNGQLIQFTQSEIYDWMYYENNKMIGNFTACALLKDEPKAHQEEFKRAYGLECED